MMETEGSGTSWRGEDDLVNEDAYLVEEGLGLYVVCDGLSQRPAGELAANLAVEALEEFVAAAQHKLGDTLHRQLASRSFASRALRYALESVLRTARSDPRFKGMATTVTMLLAQRRIGVVGHSGDSRAYLLRRDRIHRLTADHEWTEVLNEGDSDDSLRSMEVFAIELRPGDTFVLCSDGAERVVEDRYLVSNTEALSPRLLASRIVTAAHRANPFQDATVVVVRVRGELESGWLSLSETPRATEFGHALPAIG